MSTSSMASGGGGESSPVVSVSTVAWKRRSGFGKLSGSVGIGSSWERRKIVLVGTKLAYYTITGDEGSERQLRHPRGTLDVVSERLTVSPAVHCVDMPTPYGLILRAKAQSLGAEDTTKWKLCFDTRQQQAAFLLALSDVVVSRAVTEFNASVLATESDKWASHGGFHRLYEEGGQGIFSLVRGVLLQENKVANDTTETTDTSVGPSEQSGVEHDNQEKGAEISHKDDEVLHESEGGQGDSPGDIPSPESTMQKGDKNGPLDPKVAAEPSANDQACRDLPGNILDGEIYLSLNNIRALFGLVNVVVLYTFWVANVSSSPVLLWWQVLVVVNFGLWILLKKPMPKSQSLRSHSTDKSQDGEIGREKGMSALAKQPEKDDVDATTAAGESTVNLSPAITNHSREVVPTVSTVGAELLREKDVPLSEVPQEKLMKEATEHSEKAKSRVEQRSLSEEEMDFHAHERWALSDPKVDLSGSWVLIADDSFKAEYDIYLRNLGFNRLTRGVAVSLISRTTEVTRQSERGRSLYLCGKNPKGSWERTIVASGYPDFETQSERTAGKDYFHRSHSIKTAESEDVEAEAWWEDRGRVHISWLRGGTKYGGGDFESRRYVQVGDKGSSDDILVCESVFHPKKKGKEKAEVTWKFKRVENDK